MEYLCKLRTIHFLEETNLILCISGLGCSHDWTGGTESWSASDHHLNLILNWVRKVRAVTGDGLRLLFWYRLRAQIELLYIWCRQFSWPWVAHLNAGTMTRRLITSRFAGFSGRLHCFLSDNDHAYIALTFITIQQCVFPLLIICSLFAEGPEGHWKSNCNLCRYFSKHKCISSDARNENKSRVANLFTMAMLFVEYLVE